MNYSQWRKLTVFYTQSINFIPRMTWKLTTQPFIEQDSFVQLIFINTSFAKVGENFAIAGLLLHIQVTKNFFWKKKLIPFKISLIFIRTFYNLSPFPERDGTNFWNERDGTRIILHSHQELSYLCKCQLKQDQMMF